MSEKQSTITGDSRITLSILGGVLLCAFYVGVVVTRIDNRMSGLEESVREGWTLSNQKLWAAQMKANNNGLNIPDVDSIRGRK